MSATQALVDITIVAIQVSKTAHIVPGDAQIIAADLQGLPGGHGAKRRRPDLTASSMASPTELRAQIANLVGQERAVDVRSLDCK